MGMQFGTRAYGDLSVTGAKIAANAIVNSKVDAAAAISLSKLAALTASRALVSDGSGVVSVSSVTATELGYLSGVTSAIQTQLNALNSGTFRRRSVINIVDCTAAPPTEVSGDRYILNFAVGDVHADWDGCSKGQIVTFGGSTWTGETPSEGWKVYADTPNVDYLYVDDGTPAWQSTATQSMYLQEGKIFIGDATNTATGQSVTGDVTISTAGVTAIAAGVIVNADINASAAIAESKLSLDYSTSGLNTAITNHTGSTNNPHSVTKSQILTGNLIVNADIDNAAAIADSKLAQITSANKVAGSAVQLNAAGGLENSTGLQINVDATNNTTKINASNELEGLKANLESITLVAQDITNQYVDLSKLIHPNSLHLDIISLPVPKAGTDYTLSTQGGVTRISFAGDLATSGACELVAGDVLQVRYFYL